MIKKKFLFITSGRADFGIISNLYKDIKNNKNIKSKIIVCGNHFDKRFGFSFNELIEKKIRDIIKINIKLKNDKKKNILFYISDAIKILTKILDEEKPNLVILLGDRYEAFSAAISCLILNIPIAHIHGGEVTYGAFDDSIRHSITKMSILHFTSTEEYKKRVIQLGENPKNVFNVGSLGVENIKIKKKITISDQKKLSKIKFNSKNLLISYHSVTNQKDLGMNGFKNLISSLDKLYNTNLIFTGANADPGGIRINKLINSYVKKNKKKSVFIKNLGQNLFHIVLKKVDCIIGNSSSGIIEAPSLNIPTINIGQRQQGRIMSKSIISIGENKNEISRSIKKIYTNKFIKSFKNQKEHYKKDKTSRKIIKELNKFNIFEMEAKKFYDILI
jgi:GDP/UDP-N,N'-diacetylbacillosamine 2-epimerase (hydrolysing)